MLHYTTYDCPTSNEWVTFIHGAGGSSSIWFRQLRAFKQHFNVLLLDLRGHGQSGSPPLKKWQRYTFTTIGDDVLEVLDHLKIQKTHFVGISLGTIIIRELAERLPERCSSLVMGGAVMKINFKGRFLMRMGNLLKSVVPYLLLYRLFAWVIMPRANHRESRNLFIQEAKKLYQREFKRWFALTAQVKPLLKLFRFRDPGVPTLYIMGAEDHMFLPSVEAIVSEHDSATLHVVPDCGHVVNVEQPNVFNEQVLAFLRQ